MSEQPQLVIFGEVLFDCFPSGEQILGGAPFNVAWNLQAFGDQPIFVSRVGEDALGHKILDSMKAWGMATAFLQKDSIHSTGKVEVSVVDNEPHYLITPDSAYDFIDAHALPILPTESILYHGSLALRNPVSRYAFQKMAMSLGTSIFMDVNLRAPWWKTEEIYYWLEAARWVKLNSDELRLLGFISSNIDHALTEFLERFELEQVILTQGAEGAIVLTDEGGRYQVVPQPVEKLVDTVGAGDAFTSVYLHGIIHEWTIEKTLDRAQRFASQVIGLRGATTTDKPFYTFKE